jgi:hypothetical protein
MWYAGPFAFALAIPAAFRDAWRDNPKSANEHWARKVYETNKGLAEFFTSQTPLHNVSGFLRIIGGEEDFTNERMLGFTAGQFIPASGFVRYVSNIVDPTFRRSSTFLDTIKRDLPVLSKDLKPYQTPTGESAQRKLSDYLLPFPIGHEDKMYDKDYKDRNAQLQSRSQNDRDLDDLAKMVKAGKAEPIDLVVHVLSHPSMETTRLKQRLRRNYPELADEWFPKRATAGRNERLLKIGKWQHRMSDDELARYNAEKERVVREMITARNINVDNPTPRDVKMLQTVRKIAQRRPDVWLSRQLKAERQGRNGTP